MDERYLKYIENSLTQLDKATTWIFLTLMVIILTNSKSEEYEFGSIKIKKGQSGLVFYIILCGLNFHILKLLQLLSSSFALIKNKAAAMKDIQSSTWIFNPFSRTTGLMGIITDNIGLPLLIILWWLGFALVNKEISISKYNSKLSTFIMILFCLYLLFGLFSLLLIQDLLLTMGSNRDKLISQLAGIIIGGFIFYLIERKEKFLKAIFSYD